jgi:hypothetical protein
MAKIKNIQIRKGIPIPPRLTHRPIRSPITKALLQMEIGDSIDLPNTPTNRSSVYVRIKRKGYKLTVRTLDNGEDNVLRVWRIK